MSTVPLTAATGEDIAANEINAVGDGAYARYHSPANYATSTSTWTSLAGITLPFYKRYDDTNVRVDLTLQAQATVAGDELEVAISVNNLATTPLPGSIVAHRKFSTIGVFTTISGTAGFPAAVAVGSTNNISYSGAYSVMLIWHRKAGTGSISVPASGLPIMFRLREFIS